MPLYATAVLGDGSEENPFTSCFDDYPGVVWGMHRDNREAQGIFYVNSDPTPEQLELIKDDPRIVRVG